MKIFVRSLFLATALVGSAAADTQPPTKKAPAEKAPPAKDAKAPAGDAKREVVAPADVEQFLAFFNKFVDTIVAAKEDCVVLTKNVNALIDANAPLVKKFQEAKAANKELPQSAKDKMMSRVKEMMPALNKCGADPGFSAAMKRMESGKSAPPPPAKSEPAKEPAKAPATKTETTKAPAKAPTPSK